MSQSAEQTATDDVPPGGQTGVKRQFSADAFRALTARLNGQQPNPPLASVGAQPLSGTGQQADAKPAVAPVPEPTAQSPGTSQFAPDAESAIEQIVDEPQVQVSEPVVELPVVAVADTAPQAVPAPETKSPVFEKPITGTTIILNTDKKTEPVTPEQMVEQERGKAPEAFYLDITAEETADGQAAAPESPVATIDPLQAAMDLMRASDTTPVIDEVTPDKGVAPVIEAFSQISGDPVVKTTKKPAQAPPESGESNQAPIELEPDAESGETARALLDIMSSGSQPQERALAADTLLRLVPRMMVKDMIALSERVCMMTDAPPLLVNALINHREPRVAGPLLEDGKTINEQDLLRLIATTDVDRLIMMAKHRAVSQTVCDALIARGEPSVYLTLVRNPGAALSHDAFVAFSEIAKSQSSLQAPLATRGDTPPPIAFELFWSLPVELRRYVLSRFLTDSTTLDKILKITKSVDGGVDSDHKFPPKRKVEELINLVTDGVTDQAADMMAELAGINQDNARRIIADPDGEPLTVALKTMGQTRAQFSQAIKKCASSSKAMLRGDRDLAELQIMFDLLSFNKARTLLTYWDWAIEKTGPYTRRVM